MLHNISQGRPRTTLESLDDMSQTKKDTLVIRSAASGSPEVSRRRNNTKPLATLFALDRLAPRDQPMQSII
jgi:hypothetical protein